MATPALTIDRLTLTGFRNYHALRLEITAAHIVLCGANGAGKTNLLEAISMLTPGRGMRSSPMEDLVAQTASNPGWAVAATITGRHGETKIGTSWQPGVDGGAARILKINGTSQRTLNVLDEHIRILWLTPAMDRLFAGPSSDRRRFLDRLVLAYDAEHGSHINAFERAMRERNRLLTTHNADKSWLDAVELQMAEHGVAAAAARLATINQLSVDIAARRTANSTSPFPWAAMEIDGVLETELKTNPAVQVEDKYRKLLADSRVSDRLTGRTGHGPHRSDLIVVHGPKQTAARLCSTGEQKALLTGIVLAHAHTVKKAFSNLAPILLLDEVTAHLDRDRRAGLFAELDELDAQCWMTGTDHGLFAELTGHPHILNVRDGHVSPATGH